MAQQIGNDLTYVLLKTTGLSTKEQLEDYVAACLRWVLVAVPAVAAQVPAAVAQQQQLLLQQQQPQQAGTGAAADGGASGSSGPGGIVDDYDDTEAAAEANQAELQATAAQLLELIARANSSAVPQRAVAAEGAADAGALPAEDPELVSASLALRELLQEAAASSSNSSGTGGGTGSGNTTTTTTQAMEQLVSSLQAMVQRKKELEGAGQAGGAMELRSAAASGPQARTGATAVTLPQAGAGPNGPAGPPLLTLTVGGDLNVNINVNVVPQTLTLPAGAAPGCSCVCPGGLGGRATRACAQAVPSCLLRMGDSCREDCFGLKAPSLP